MSDLADFVMASVTRNSCECGRCADAPDRDINPDINPDTVSGKHSVSVEFFDVGLIDGLEPDAVEFRRLVNAQDGVFGEATLFDGEEHNYIELGGWIGDQGLALLTMALGDLLGVWTLMTPTSMLGELVPKELRMTMAGSGMVAIKAEKELGF